MGAFGEEDEAEWKKAVQHSYTNTEEGAYFVELTVLLKETKKRVLAAVKVTEDV